MDRQAVVSAVVVDIDGHIYVSDSEELFAFYSNGALKWSIPISDTVYTTAITIDGYLVAITEDGEVMAINRGDGSLAADSPYLAPLPEGRVINTPAIHPVTNRIYIVTGDAGVGYGYFYGIDFTPGSLGIAGDGSIIGTVELRDVCEGAAIVASNGGIYVSHGSVTSSIAYRLNRVLPPELRIPKPLGGITAL